MDVNTLIDNIRNGDEESFEILLDEYHNMIYKIIGSFDLQKGDYLIDSESLYQEGCIALYKAVNSYEKDKEMSFSSYAYMLIRARLHTYVRDVSRQFNNSYYSIDNTENINYEIIARNNYIHESPISYHREKEFEEYLNKFINKLSDEDKEIFRLRVEDYSYKEISERLNIKTKRIDNRLRTLRKKLKEYLGNEEE